VIPLISQVEKYKIALIQMESKFLDKKYNLNKAINNITTAASYGAALICLPEGFLTGYRGNGIHDIVAIADTTDSPYILSIVELAKQLKVHILVPYFRKLHDNTVQNSAVLIDENGKICGSYSKTHLIGGEKGNISRGEGFPVWKTKLGIIGCLICYDICFPETVRIMALKKAQLILVPSAWRGSLYYSRWWNLNIACRALDNLIYVAAINQVGPCGAEAFAGNSKLCDPVGRIIAECNDTEEKIIYGIIDLTRIEYERSINTVLCDRQTDLYGI
jgi:predicted amidohydrolase